MSPSPEFAEERRARILKLVEERGRVKVTELTELLNVTAPTVRKDIAALDRERKVRRTHGGALAASQPAHEIHLETRRTAHAEEKRRIARACVDLISSNDSVYLDAGTTTLAIAELIAEDSTASRRFGYGLNVLTNSAIIGRTLSDRGTVNCTVVGGQYRAIAESYVGPLSLQAVKQFTVNLAFVGVSGISGDQFSVADLAEADLKRAVIDQARRVVVPMDQSKVGLSDFVSLCKLADIDIVVTDDTETYLAALCASSDVELVIAS